MALRYDLDSPGVKIVTKLENGGKAVTEIDCKAETWVGSAEFLHKVSTNFSMIFVSKCET